MSNVIDFVSRFGKRPPGKLWSLPAWSDMDVAIITLAEREVSIWRTRPDPRADRSAALASDWEKAFQDLGEATNAATLHRIRARIRRRAWAIFKYCRELGYYPPLPPKPGRKS